MTQALQALLRELEGGAQSLEHLQQALYNARFTGPLTIHCVGGRPKQIDIGAPVRIRVVEGEQPGRLDKPPGT